MMMVAKYSLHKFLYNYSNFHNLQRCVCSIANSGSYASKLSLKQNNTTYLLTAWECMN